MPAKKKAASAEATSEALAVIEAAQEVAAAEEAEVQSVLQAAVGACSESVAGFHALIELLERERAAAEEAAAQSEEEEARVQRSWEEEVATMSELASEELRRVMEAASEQLEAAGEDLGNVAVGLPPRPKAGSLGAGVGVRCVATRPIAAGEVLRVDMREW